MHQLINKNKIYFYIFSFLFLTTISNESLIKKLKNYFLITSIEVKTERNEIKEEISSKINYLFYKNILSIKKKPTIKILDELNILESIKIKKKYPSTLIIEAKKTDLLGITFINEKKYYVGKNEKFIKSEEIIKQNNLPFIFGKFDIKNYLSLISILSHQNINFDKITKYYYHKNKRWDLYFDNNILIKLPDSNIEEAIILYNNFKSIEGIKSNSIVDLRIQKRITIKND